jgi:glycosyltransferase involved in cell wall biosynthesis
MKPLRVLLTADPYIPVPPKLYGGIERILDMIARGLADRGHEVLLVAHPESATVGELIPYGVPPHTGFRARAIELFQVMAALARRAFSVDVVHSFGRLGGMFPILPLHRVPKIQSYQRECLGWRNVTTASLLGRDSICFTGCSRAVYRERENHPRAGRWVRIFNGATVEKYTPRYDLPSDAPLAYLGRVERVKGVHSAIAIAKMSGKRLIIAGNKVLDGDEPDYFAREIEPHLDGDRIQYVGPLDDVAKAALLGTAAATLMPIEIEDAFPVVLPESLACGTPVIGFARGGLPEGILDGKNGFLARNVEEAVAAVGRLSTIDRRAVRKDCETRFSHQVIVGEYEDLYREMVARCASSW